MSKTKTTTVSTGYTRCHHSHPALSLGAGTVYGGACSAPHPEADITVALDSWSGRDVKSYPWDEKTKVIRVNFPITDMAAPSNLGDFRNMIDWLELQLLAGKKVHIGCIGGHGRTGTVLAALVNQMTGEEDAVMWVRKNYCKKVVESSAQVNWLHKHYGIKKAPASKESTSRGLSGGTEYRGGTAGGLRYAGDGRPGWQDAGGGDWWRTPETGNTPVRGKVTPISQKPLAVDRYQPEGLGPSIWGAKPETP